VVSLATPVSASIRYGLSMHSVSWMNLEWNVRRKGGFGQIHNAAFEGGAALGSS